MFSRNRNQAAILAYPRRPGPAPHDPQLAKPSAYGPKMQGGPPGVKSDTKRPSAARDTPDLETLSGTKFWI